MIPHRDLERMLTGSRRERAGSNFPDAIRETVRSRLQDYTLCLRANNRLRRYCGHPGRIVGITFQHPVSGEMRRNITYWSASCRNNNSPETGNYPNTKKTIARLRMNMNLATRVVRGSDRVYFCGLLVRII